MDMEQLKVELAQLSREQINWFAARCVLRMLPVLAYKGENFPFFGEMAAEWIFTVFRACSASISALPGMETRSSTTVDACAIHAAAAARSARSTRASYTARSALKVCVPHYNATAYATFVSDSAIYAAIDATIEVATHVTFATSTTVAATYAARVAADAVGAVARAAYAADAETFSDAVKRAARVTQASDCFVDAASADVKAIISGSYLQWPDLWHGCAPQWLSKLAFTFLTGLRGLGLEFWAETYQQWLVGIFDWEKIERCLSIPISTIEAGPKAMLAYLMAENLTRAAEARVVFLGEGGAGKTTLIRLLFGEKIQPSEPATPRVEIRKRKETIAGNETLVHYWDFGGQVVMHATHQFFLREQSVYVVVLDIRRGDDLEYWLDHVRVFAAGASTLIVLNKVDQLPPGMEIRHPFDLAGIRRRYPFVLDAVYPISCQTEEGVDSFGSILQEQIAASHILNSDMPLKWFHVKEALELENQDFIGRKRFDEICHAQDLVGEEMDTALKVLDILGVAIHFPNLIRHRDVVLNPEWITKAIYEIIWASEREHCNGILDAQLVRKIFDTARAEKRLDIEVPDDKYDFLLDLMTEFKLAFMSGAQGRYCTPMLAQTNEPSHNIDREVGLRFIFQLPFLPPGLFYRFIAESGEELMDNLIWKAGVILENEENQVLVEYSEYQRTITFYAYGPQPGLYLTVLRQRLMKLMGESYKDLVYEPYIIASDGERISWREMTRRYNIEGEAAKVYTDLSRYSINELLMKYFDNDFREMLQKEFDLMRRDFMVERIKEGISIEVNPTICPTMQNTTTVDVTMTVSNETNTALQLDSDLKELGRIIRRFKEDEGTLAAEHEKEIKQLQRDIKDLQEDIGELTAITEIGPMAEARKKPVLGRIKNGWNSLAEIAKKHYYILGFVEKVHGIAEYMTKTDWSHWKL